MYEQLADAFAHAKDKVIIAKVDADGEGRPLGQKYGVTGFPSTSKVLQFWRQDHYIDTQSFSIKMVRS